MSPQPKILLLYTGGTIGMVKDAASGTLKPFKFSNLLKQIPDLSLMNCQIATDSLDAPIDSSNMSVDHWQRLAKRIAIDYHKYDGFVVLHGSDTMAYSSSALSFMFKNLSKPVIFTGSQLPIGIPRSDARENLLTSIEIALARNEEGGPKVPEVAVYFENNLFRGNRLHKISTQDFKAFQSMNYPKLAEAGVKIKYHNNYIFKGTSGSFSLNSNMSRNVGVLTAFPGMAPAFALPILENTQLNGLIFRTFGSGNTPTDSWLLQALEKCIKRGTQVINASQCDGGGVFMGQYESGRALLDLGVVSALDMTFEAAITKLMHLLPFGLSADDFKEQYETSLRGELSS
jgi:L-asparaginase